MPQVLSVANGNFTSSSTWYLVDNGTFLDTTSNVLTLTTGISVGTAFTPASTITVPGVMLRFSTKATGAVGTMTVNLTTSAGVSQASVTINVADLPDMNGTPGTGLGWIYFKFASPVTLNNTTSYQLRLNTSVNSTVTIFCSSPSSIFAKAIVTTANAAPGAGDTIFVAGEYSGPGVNASYTVTMDNTATTAFGNVYVSPRGTLAYGTAASTNYLLRMAGNLLVHRGATFTMGSASAPIPDSSTARLELSLTTNGQFSIRVSGTFETYGAVKTTYTTLAADAAAGATSVTLSAVPTGWNAGDVVFFTSTTSTVAQVETRTLASNVTTTTATLTAGLTNAHGGNPNTLVQGHVASYTRNTVITTTTPAANIATYFMVDGNQPTLSIYNTEMIHVGASTATIGAGIGFAGQGTIGGSVTLRNSIMKITASMNAVALYMAGNFSGATLASYNITNNFIYNYNSNPFVNLATANYTEATTAIQENLFCRNGAAVLFNDWKPAQDNNIYANSTATGVTYQPYSTNTANFFGAGTKTISGTIVYGNASSGISLQNSGSFGTFYPGPGYITFANTTIWRSGSGSNIAITGFDLQDNRSQVAFDNLRTFGGSTTLVNGNQMNSKVIFKNSYFWSGTTVVTAYAYVSTNVSTAITADSIFFDNCVFGRDHLGNTSNLTLGAFRMEPARGGHIFVHNPTFSGTIAVRNSTFRGWNYAQSVIVSRENGVAGANAIYSNNGTVSTDSTVFNTAAPSIRVTPVAANNYVATSPVRVPVAAGSSCTVSVWVRQAPTYNGANASLILRYNPLANIQNDTTVASSTTLSTWEQLSYTTGVMTDDTVLEFYVQCNGTAGFINVDDWSTSASFDSRGSDYIAPFVGFYVEPDFQTGGSGGEKSFTFVG